MDGKSKRIPLPKEEWVLVERPDLQIINTEVFDMAQRITKSKQTTYNHNDKAVMRKNFEGKHLFANRVICADCGKYLHFGYADRKETIPVYRTHNHGECHNPYNRIAADTLIEMTISAINQSIALQDDAIQRVERLLYENIKKDNNMAEMERIDSEIKKLEDRMVRISNAFIDEDFKDNAELKASFIKQSEETAIEKKRLTERKEELIAITDTSAIEQKIEHLKQALSEFKMVKSIDRDRVLTNIKTIKLYNDGSIDIVMVSGITFNNGVGKNKHTDILLH